MAKKAKKVSWRTLTRKADKARNPRTASRLRKQAHELRRSVRKIAASRAAPPNVSTGLSSSQNRALVKRAAKGWATRRAKTEGGLAANAATLRAVEHQIDGMRFDTTERGLPGHGELVGGVFSQIADRIAKLSRKKGGTDAIQNELATLASSSKYEGCVETDKAATKRLVEVQERMAERILCGFIAEVDTCTAQHHGLPVAMTWNLNSFLIVKIVDALNKAGYRATGKT